MSKYKTTKINFESSNARINPKVSNKEPDIDSDCPTKYFFNQNYPRLGFTSFSLEADEKKIIPLKVKLDEESQVILTFSIFLNLLDVSSNLFWDLRRDGESIVDGPRVFIAEPQDISGEFAVPWYHHDQNVPSGRHLYELVFINNSENKATVDNYTFVAQVRKNDGSNGNVFSKQFYGERSPVETRNRDDQGKTLKDKEISKGRKFVCKKCQKPSGDLISICPNTSRTISLSVPVDEKNKSDVMLYFAGESQLSGNIRELFFNIRRRSPASKHNKDSYKIVASTSKDDSVSLTNGDQPLVTEKGTLAINWVTLDKSIKGPVEYSIDLINKGSEVVNILAYTIIASVVSKNSNRECLTFASNEAYACPISEAAILKESSVTPFKVKAKPSVRGQVLLTINFELNITDLNVLIYFDVRRDDGVSITNGPQPWVLSFGNSGNVRIETNTVIFDPDAPLDTKFYTVEIINQDDVDVGVLYYSITSEAV